MRIVEYKTKRFKQVFRSSNSIPEGTTIYLIEYHTGQYFWCAYTRKVSAAMIKDKLTASVQEKSVNSIYEPEAAAVSEITPDDIRMARGEVTATENE